MTDEEEDYEEHNCPVTLKTTYSFRLNKFDTGNATFGYRNVDAYHFMNSVKQLDSNVGVVIKHPKGILKNHSKHTMVLNYLNNVHCALYKVLLDLYREDKQPDCIKLTLDHDFKIIDFVMIKPESNYKKPKSNSKEYEGFLNFGIF